MYFINAVAPDWNLKEKNARKKVNRMENAVAPDWNLKLVLAGTLAGIGWQCSRTRLEFKGE